MHSLSVGMDAILPSVPMSPVNKDLFPLKRNGNLEAPSSWNHHYPAPATKLAEVSPKFMLESQSCLLIILDDCLGYPVPEL
jgi:hypothetical protein